MSFLATTRGAVLRGSTTNDLGDEVASDTVAPGLGDLPLSIIERSREVFDQSTGTPRTVRTIAARLPPTVQLEDGDRIRDNRTGLIYAIDGATRTPRGIAGTETFSLTLRLTRG